MSNTQAKPSINLQELHIPARPEILCQLQALKEGEKADTHRLAEIIVHDVGLSSAVLSTVNAPYFGLKNHVSDIKQAAVLLGPKHLTHLITYYALRQAVSQATPSIPLAPLWEQADEVANITTLLARELDICIPEEELYSAALFHNCGIAVMAISFDNYDLVLATASANTTKSVIHFEHELLGLDRCEAGYELAKRWFLPESIQDVIKSCYNPACIINTSTTGLIVSLIKAASHLSAIETENDASEWAHIYPLILESLDLTQETWKALEVKLTEGRE